MANSATILVATLLIATGAEAQTDIQELTARADAGIADAQYQLGVAY